MPWQVPPSQAGQERTTLELLFPAQLQGRAARLRVKLSAEAAPNQEDRSLQRQGQQEDRWRPPEAEAEAAELLEEVGPSGDRPRKRLHQLL